MLVPLNISGYYPYICIILCLYGVFSGDELFSDVLPMETVENVFYKVKGKVYIHNIYVIYLEPANT